MATKVDTFATTPIVYHGAGALEKLPGVIENLGAQRPAVFTDPGVVSAGVLDQLLSVLKEKPACFTDVEPEPPETLVETTVQFLKSNNCDLVIALGGGSVIDTAKMAAALMGNPGSIHDYWGLDKVTRPGLPLIAIPTTAGTGSEVTPAAVFRDTTANVKKGVRSLPLFPRLAILDPLLTVSLPQGPTASTGVDALTHAIEAYTAKNLTLMSDMAAEKAIEMIAANLLKAFKDGGDLAAREGMLIGSYLAGISFGVANVGAVHSIAQTIGGMYKVAHGTANAVLLPYVMAFNRVACVEKYARVAELMGENIAGLSAEEASLSAVESVRKLTKELQIPQHVSELGIKEDAIDDIAKACLESQGRLLVLNVREAGIEEVRQILKEAF